MLRILTLAWLMRQKEAEKEAGEVIASGTTSGGASCTPSVDHVD